MKYLVIVPDGMADHPLEELGGRTPLEVAHIANMTYMVQNGLTGLVQTIPDRLPAGSDIGNLALMGYNPETCFTGRAPLEAANMGIDLADDEIAFRCNLVTIVGHKMEDYSAGHISTKEAALLVEALNEGIREEGVRFYAGKSYRHIMVMKTRHVKDFMKIPSVPPHDIMGKKIDKYLPQGAHGKTILKLLEKSSKILTPHSVNAIRVDLKENPANLIWLWGQGTRPKLPRFEERYGVRGAIISAVELVNGIGRLAGLEVLQVPGITGYYDTNYAGKAQYALNALKTKDFVFVHIEGPDEAGHNGDAKAKIHCIEQIDRQIIGPVLNHFDKTDDVRILVTPDHPTPVALRTHAHEPVGFIMYGKGIEADGTGVYNEKAAKEKGIVFKSGEDMMRFFIKHGI